MSAALVLALALAAGQGAASLPITLDVVVTDAQGRTVTTLQTVDFAVDEHGTPQRVVSARFVKALPPVVVDAARLFGASKEVQIDLQGVRYRLRITRRGKLILQK